MPEYITKEQAINVVHEAIANIINSDSEMVCLADLEIEIQMTITDYTEPADVAPVVHARWEVMRDPYGEIEGFLCSCGHESLSASNYCPECGARMDGGESDD